MRLQENPYASCGFLLVQPEGTRQSRTPALNLRLPNPQENCLYDARKKTHQRLSRRLGAHRRRRRGRLLRSQPRAHRLRLDHPADQGSAGAFRHPGRRPRPLGTGQLQEAGPGIQGRPPPREEPRRLREVFQGLRCRRGLDPTEPRGTQGAPGPVRHRHLPRREDEFRPREPQRQIPRVAEELRRHASQLRQPPSTRWCAASTAAPRTRSTASSTRCATSTSRRPKSSRRTLRRASSISSG